MKVLFLSRWYPSPADNGSKIRIANLLSALCRVHDVTLISFFSPELGSSASLPAVVGPRNVCVCAFREFNPTSFRSIIGFVSSEPRYLIDTHSAEMSEIIKTEVNTAHPDLIVASQLSMAAYYKDFHGIPAILEELELGMFLPRDGRRLSWPAIRSGLTWRKHRRYIARLLSHFRLCTVVSDTERQLVEAAAPGCCPVHVIPNSIDVERYDTAAATRSTMSLIFAGPLRYEPNRDAILWFLQNVFPLIKAEMPEVKLTVTGDPGPLPLPFGPDVEYTGSLPDVTMRMATSSVSIVPIREGGGTRLKILEAMAVRTPIVTTSKGVEGIEARNGEHLLIADSPADFAKSVLKLLRRTEYARQLAKNAFSLVQERYSASETGRRFLSLAAEAIQPDAIDNALPAAQSI